MSSADAPIPLQLGKPVRLALADGRPIVALETTVFTHGLPAPHHLDVAARMSAAVESQGATPALVGVLGGRVRVGLSLDELEGLIAAGPRKASRRDLALLIATGADGATTVAGTMACAALAGIEIFATGGIGGVHPGGQHSLDVSADLRELGRTPVAVVCSGAKSILDLGRTLEVLETEGVPVVGYRTGELPAFYLRLSGMALEARVESVDAAAALVRVNRALDATGLVIANPVAAQYAIDALEHDSWVRLAEREARAARIEGSALTPWLLGRLFELSEGRTLEANRALLLDNAELAARIAVEVCQQRRQAAK